MAVNRGAAVALLGLMLSSGCAARSGLSPVATVPADSSSGVTVESTDTRLAAALLMEKAVPTAESHLQVAREYMRLGVLDAAQARTDRALKQAPRLSSAHELMARIWRDWGVAGEGLG
nr:hypothetical protein [Acidobacteriota bacterium]